MALGSWFIRFFFHYGFILCWGSSSKDKCRCVPCHVFKEFTTKASILIYSIICVKKFFCHITFYDDSLVYTVYLPGDCARVFNPHTNPVVCVCIIYQIIFKYFIWEIMYISTHQIHNLLCTDNQKANILKDKLQSQYKNPSLPVSRFQALT